MPRSYEIRASSRVGATPQRVWAHATSMAGVNRELFPLARMTFPERFAVLEPGVVRTGERAFRSWVLLFGIVPVDYDDITIVEYEAGRRFLEQSPMFTQRSWRHERTIDACEGGAVVTDSVRFVPRVGFLGGLQRAIFALAFRLRHRNLVRLFGNARP